jgi:hypothetical protein
MLHLPFPLTSIFLPILLFCSRTVTCIPFLAAVIAAQSPAAPPPIIIIVESRHPELVSGSHGIDKLFVGILKQVQNDI